MQTIPIEVPDKLAAMLDVMCSQHGIKKQEMLQEIIVRYIEDDEDVKDAMRVIAANEPTISLAEVERKYGLDD